MGKKQEEDYNKRLWGNRGGGQARKQNDASKSWYDLLETVYKNNWVFDGVLEWKVRGRRGGERRSTLKNKEGDKGSPYWDNSL